MNGWEFKDDAIVKCDGQRGNILNFDLVVQRLASGEKE
jgi:hypothetical protein